ESYVHRIGRTGRAGRSGEAILFISPRERNMLRVIERATRKPIERMELPTIADVNEQRVARFNARITDAIASGAAEPFKALIENYEREHNMPAADIAAALASLVQGKKPLLLEGVDAPRTPHDEPKHERDTGRKRQSEHESRGAREDRTERHHPKERPDRDRKPPRSRESEAERLPKRPRAAQHEAGMETFRIEVGRAHGVTPRNIVGAIANEAGLDGQHIGRVVIEEDHSFVDLPEGMPKEVFRDLQKVRVAGQKMQISRALKTQTERLSRDRRPAERTSPGKRKGAGRK
ncbi:MAG TPA: DbpA RNA binding domain-containing protein, partial [Steroidobacteraceae bacterium]|nr:DbpA RNA binding domain-containing protein [Steroidobacteraceae bacterium]